VNSIAFHYDYDHYMFAQRKKAYQENIFNAILESKGYSYCYFIKMLLGGLSNEQL